MKLFEAYLLTIDFDWLPGCMTQTNNQIPK